MPSPTNQTALTAMDCSPLPFSVTQAVSTEGSSLQLWYTYTTGADDRELGAVAWADITSGYQPKIFMYTGPASAPVPYHVFGSPTRAICVPVDPSTTYLFKVIQGGGASPLGADLTFILKAGPQNTAPADSIIACEENNLFRTSILSVTTDNDVKFYIQDNTFMTSSAGAEMDDGTIIGNGSDGGTTDLVSIYDPNLVRIYNALPSYYSFTPGFATDGVNKWYLGYVPAGTNPLVIRTLNKNGTETSDVWTLGVGTNSGNGTVFAPNRAGTKLYYGGRGGTSISPLHVWDLVGNVALADIHPGFAGYTLFQLLVLPDDTILGAYGAVATDWKIVHFDGSGTILNTYNLGAHRFDGMRAALDAPNSFIYKVFDTLTSPTRATYVRLKVSDGSIISQAQYDLFNGGPSQVSYRAPASYTPATAVPLFGPPGTCTFYTSRVSLSPTPTPPATPSGQLFLSKLTLPTASDAFTVVNDLVKGILNGPTLGVGLDINSGLPSLAAITLMGWWKLPSPLTSDFWSFFALLSDDNAFATPYYWLSTTNDGSGTLQLEHWDGATATDVTGVVLPVDEWFHVAWVINGTNHKVYINGVLSINTTFAADVTLSHLFAYTDILGGLKSALANLKIWERALTITEIAAEKYSTIAIDDTNIYNTTPIITLADALNDHSGNGNNWSFSATEGNVVTLTPGYDVIMVTGDLLKFLLTPATYSIVETVLAGYTASYNISTGDPNTAIVVIDGATVTVLITNAAHGTITVGKLTTPFDATHLFHLTAGGGLSPATFDLLSEAGQVFDPVPAGSGYSIAEDPDTDWFPTFLISNADDDTNDDITVGPGENVTVVVLNKLGTKYSGLYVLTPDKKTDTLLDQGNAPVELKIPNPFFETGLVGDE